MPERSPGALRTCRTHEPATCGAIAWRAMRPLARKGQGKAVYLHAVSFRTNKCHVAESSLSPESRHAVQKLQPIWSRGENLHDDDDVCVLEGLSLGKAGLSICTEPRLLVGWCGRKKRERGKERLSIGTRQCRRTLALCNRP